MTSRANHHLRNFKKQEDFKKNELRKGLNNNEVKCREFQPHYTQKSVDSPTPVISQQIFNNAVVSTGCVEVHKELFLVRQQNII